MKKNNIAVVGAGISGLSCAYELQKSGAKVTVFEKEKSVGGRMRTRPKSFFPFDIGADHLCNLYEHMKEYCRELDVGWQEMEFVHYRILKDGKLKTFEGALGWWSKFRLFIEQWRSNRSLDWMNFFNLSSVADLDTESGFDYIERRISREAAEYFADACTSTYQFHRADEVSVAATRAIMQSMWNNHVEWYLQRTKGGMSALPEALSARLTVHKGMEIKSIRGGEKPTVEKESFDAVVIAATAPSTKKILKNPTDQQKTLLQTSKFSCSISIAFEVHRKLLPDISVVWVPFVENQVISGFVNESMKGSELIKDDKTLICTWLHESVAKKLLEKSDNEIFEFVQSELVSICPWIKNMDDVKPYDLQRWPEAMPKFYPGWLRKVESFLNDGQGQNNIFLCGDYLNSPWTEGALRCGQRVATQVIEHLDP